MSVAFKRGSTTGSSDLNITIRDTLNNLMDPYRLEYAVYDRTTGLEVLMGSPVNTPVRLSQGQYYAQVVIAADGNVGDWLIRWTVQDTSVDPVYQTVQEFNVVGDSMIASFTGDANFDALIHSLRIILRDNNPDRNYKFRPPSSEKFIQGQTQVFGFIWEDEEMVEYLYMAVDDFNSRPPTTGLQMGNLWGSERRWRTTIIIRAAAFACFAISMNWIADEFSVGKNEKIKVRIKSTGETFTLTIEQLFNIIYGDLIAYYKSATKEAISSFKYGFMGRIYTKLINKIKIWSGKHDASILRIGGAYDRNELEVESYNKSEDIEWKPIKQVMRHHTDNKKLMNVVTDNSNVTVTEDHSLYSWDTKAEIKTSDLKPGMNLLSKVGLGDIVPKYIKEIKEAPKEPYVYDLSIEGNENFFLDSGILAHNSYSISGVSLDIEKSSKYQSMKDEYINEYDKLVEANKASIKIIKGLRQARYGVGVSSSLGPLSRPGVQSRRNLLSSSGGGF